MSQISATVPGVPEGWRLRDVVATVLLLTGMLMLGIGVGSGYLTMPFLFFGALPFAVGLAHLWHVANVDGESKKRRSATVSSDSGATERLDAADDDRDPVTILKERYAAGELGDDELDRRIERIVELDELGADESKSKTRERTK